MEGGAVFWPAHPDSKNSLGTKNMQGHSGHRTPARPPRGRGQGTGKAEGAQAGPGGSAGPMGMRCKQSPWQPPGRPSVRVRATRCRACLWAAFPPDEPMAIRRGLSSDKATSFGLVPGTVLQLLKSAGAEPRETWRDPLWVWKYLALHPMGSRACSRLCRLGVCVGLISSPRGALSPCLQRLGSTGPDR